MDMKTWFKRVAWAAAMLSILVAFGCASTTKGVKQMSQMDLPEHHYFMGMNFLDKGEIDKALREFTRAKDLDPEYAPARVGIGLVLAQKGKFDEAFASMKKAKKLSSSKAERVIYHTGMIRLYTTWQGKDWLGKAEDQFNDAIDLDKNNPAPYYYMALAYKTAQEYERASMEFRRVIDLNKGYVEQADNGWKDIQRILRAMPGTKVGRDIAKLDKITRADVAALFIEELKLEKLFKNHNVKTQRTQSFPTDYKNHPLSADIDAVIGLGIRGLEPVGNRFEPDKEITRADFAVMIEDILIKVLREDNLPTRYIGSPSPFKDVDSSFYAFNAIMTCTTRGIMEADLNGYFRPEGPVSGADALLSLRRLKEALTF